MESTGQAMKIQISQGTHDYLEKTKLFKVTFRGEVEVKGKGKMKTYWLTGKDGLPFDLPSMQ